MKTFSSKDLTNNLVASIFPSPLSLNIEKISISDVLTSNFSIFSIIFSSFLFNSSIFSSIFFNFISFSNELFFILFSILCIWASFDDNLISKELILALSSFCSFINLVKSGDVKVYELGCSVFILFILFFVIN